MAWTQNNSVAVGMNLPNISAGTFPHKEEILSTYMKDGDPSHLTLTQMILKSISAMFARLQNS